MRQLSASQAKIIVATQLDATLSVAKIRSRVDLKEHTIRYALDQAREEGVIERRYFINLFKLGFLQHEVFFSLASEERGARDALLEQLKRSDAISWVGRLGGDYQYGLNICSRNVTELVKFFESLSNTYGRLFIEKTLSLRISLTYFGNRYLAPSLKPSRPLSYQSGESTVEIDHIDHLILSALTADGTMSGHQLARLLGLPQSTVDYRLKKLKSAGIIVGSYYAVKGERLGITSYLCLVSTKGISAAFREKALAFCAQHPEIVLMIESVGSWDFEFSIDAFSAEDAMKTSEQLLDHFGRDIHWLKMIPLFSYPKVLEYPFSSSGQLGQGRGR